MRVWDVFLACWPCVSVVLGLCRVCVWVRMGEKTWNHGKRGIHGKRREGSRRLGNMRYIDCSHNFTLLAAACGHDAACFLFSGSKPTLGGDPAPGGAMSNDRSVVSASGCEVRWLITQQRDELQTRWE
jgi:hypothetical protein